MLTKESILKNHLASVSSGGDGCRIWLSWLRFSPLMELGRYWVFNFMGHFPPAVISVLFVMLFIGALIMFYTRRVWALTRLRAALTGNVSVCYSQLCAQRSVSTAAVCLQTRASVSRDGGDWTAPVVSALQLLQPTFIYIDSFFFLVAFTASLVDKK